MGFENRDYARTNHETVSSRGSRLSIVAWIIIVNIAVFVVQCVWTKQLSVDELTRGLPPQMRDRFEKFDSRELTGVRVPVIQNWLSLDRRVFYQGQIWRLVTYDLLHSTQGQFPWHLFFNMYLLYMIGPRIADLYGEREFLLFYIASSIVSGVAFLVWGFVTGTDPAAIGASGAVSAVLVVYAMRWPDTVWMIMYVIPVTARWMVIIYACLDAFPMLKQLGGHIDGSHVAHSAHLGGMLMGYLYESRHWHLTSLVDSWSLLSRFRPRRTFRVVRHDDRTAPPEQTPTRNESQLKARLDELLAKITEHGQVSLTESEQSELKEASRFFRERQ